MKNQTLKDFKIDINKFSVEQIQELYLGLESDLNISIYANPEYMPFQMKQLRLGLQDGLNISVLSDSKKSHKQ